MLGSPYTLLFPFTPALNGVNFCRAAEKGAAVKGAKIFKFSQKAALIFYCIFANMHLVLSVIWIYVVMCI